MRTRAFVDRLTDEIIANVFLYLACDSTLNPFSKSTSWPWTIVTHVCRLWRDIALDYPILWVQIEHRLYGCRKWVLPFLQRSRTSGLYVRIELPYDLSSIDEESRALLGELSRIRKLSITPAFFDRELWLQMVSGFLSKQAPILESLEIFNGRQIQLPPSCFCGVAPDLRTLALQGVSLNWPSFPLHDLTSLRLWNIDCKIPLSQMIFIIQTSPRIEEVLISNAGPVADADEIFSDPVIDLTAVAKHKYLRMFDVKGVDANVGIQLTKYFILPQDASWYLSYIERPAPSSRTQIISSNLEFMKSARTVNIEMRREPSLTSEKAANSSFVSVNHCERDQTSVIVSSIINLFMHSNVWENMRELEIDIGEDVFQSRDSVDIISWSLLLACVPSLEKLGLRFSREPRPNQTQDGLVYALMRSNSEAQSFKCNPLCPRLRTLSLAGICFDGCNFAQTLAECLERRQEAGIRLKSLTIKAKVGSGLKHHIQAKFAAFVDDFKMILFS